MAMDREPDDQQLDGKVAIVSGAGAIKGGIGNGRAAAILLARAGAKIMAVDRDLELAAETATAAMAFEKNQRPPRPHAPSAEEAAAHAQFLKKLSKPIWKA